MGIAAETVSGEVSGPRLWHILVGEGGPAFTADGRLYQEDQNIIKRESRASREIPVTAGMLTRTPSPQSGNSRAAIGVSHAAVMGL